MFRLKWLFVFLLSVSTCMGLRAQTSTGTIEGLVTDSTGGMIPGAVVTLTNIGTTDVRTAKANTTGAFVFSFLPPANYRISVSVQGFKQFEKSDFKLDVTSTVSVPVKLEVGSFSETITVSGSDPTLSHRVRHCPMSWKRSRSKICRPTDVTRTA